MHQAHEDVLRTLSLPVNALQGLSISDSSPLSLPYYLQRWHKQQAKPCNIGLLDQDMCVCLSTSLQNPRKSDTKGRSDPIIVSNSREMPKG